MDLLAAGYVKNPYDKCLFTLSSSDETSEDQLLLDVDDFIEGGKETHRKTMEGFYDKYRCGKAVDFRSAGQEGTRFAGRRVVQHPDFRITVSMDEYVKSKLRPIEVPKGYLSNTKEISVGMLSNINGVNGGLGWLASAARPDMAAPHSIIPSGYDRRSPQLISEVNAAVKQCHAVPITITIWPIPFAELRWTTFTDSDFDTGERQRDHQGWLVCATNKYFNQERSATVSVLHWRSRKLTRKAESPHLVETYAASSAVVEMTWIKALWESMTWKDFDILTQRRSSRPLKTMMPHVLRNENPAYLDPESTLVMASKGLFDALDNDLHQDDRNLLWKCQSFEEFMRRAMCRPRWCTHNRNATDAMTKFKEAHSEPLFTLLRTGMCTLKGEKSELADRTNLLQTGTAPRQKSERSQIRDGTNLFCSYAIGLRGSLSGVPEGGPCRLWFLLPRQSPIHYVSSADPFRLEGPLSVFFNDAIALHHCLRQVCDGPI